MHVVDPMHNLLLGTAKHMMEIWSKQVIISKQQFTHIHDVVNAISTPKQVGRVPTKIASSFAGFSADQWRNWTTVFSSVALKGAIPSNHLNCWLMYVQACKLLCTRTINKSTAKTADLYLRNFCLIFEDLYGAEHCTINIHLHLHLLDCIYDYSPLYGWWCFAFERYNGMLGNYFTNNRNIEPQIMCKFLRHQQALALKLPPEFSDLLGAFTIHNAASGSLMQTMGSRPENIMRLHDLTTSPLLSLNFCVSQSESLLSPVYEKVMPQEHADQLKTVYSHLYPGKEYAPLSLIYQQSARAC